MKKLYYLLLLIFFIIPFRVKTAYSCPDGYTLTTDTCTKTSNAYQRNGLFYCDPTTQKGATLSGGKCVWSIKATGSDDNASNDADEGL